MKRSNDRGRNIYVRIDRTSKSSWKSTVAWTELSKRKHLKKHYLGTYYIWSVDERAKQININDARSILLLVTFMDV